MDLSKLEKFLETEPKYRLRQAKEVVFQKLIENWQEATFFPMELRQKLNKECPLLIKAETFVSRTKNSVKARIKLKDGIQIESALMLHKDGRNTVCVSSQAGCPLACKFCSTGSIGFKRNLESAEIIEQLIFFSRYLKKEKKKVTNVVFMGMGEPFLNYENVMRAIKILNDKNGLNIGARNISISSVGIVKYIQKLSEEKLQLNLAISLNAPNNELRTKIMPINKEYPIEAILKAVDNYIKKTKRRVMFEYVLIKGINDSDSCAFELAKLIKKPLYFLNLILCNPSGIFRPSSFKRVERFKSILRKSGVKFSQRYRFGQDIKAACGQFVVEKNQKPYKKIF